ncbi:hypothetical protein TWF718_005472 [Orbilia javanica]|uniref:Uncharacterized protein n=1 Tax=Orbilia javanica TaxID=47235 RepID=A0AAN8RJF0_9PEZI
MPNRATLTRAQRVNVNRRAYVRPQFARVVVPHTHSVVYSICGHQNHKYIFDAGSEGDGNCYCRRIDPAKLYEDHKDKIRCRISQRTIHGRCPGCNQQTEALLERLRLEEAKEHDQALAARAKANKGDFGWESLTEDWTPVEDKKGNGASEQNA